MDWGPKRPKKEFEPPPWEKEQFEELARRKAAARPEPPAPIPVRPAEEASPAEEPVTGPEDAEETDAGKTAVAAAKPPLDPRKIDAMLIELAAEEPKASGQAWLVGMSVAVAFGVLGLVMGFWGVAATVVPRAPSQAMMFGSVVLTIMGLFFLGMGAWLFVRSMKLRGVL